MVLLTAQDPQDPADRSIRTLNEIFNTDEINFEQPSVIAKSGDFLYVVDEDIPNGTVQKIDFVGDGEHEGWWGSDCSKDGLCYSDGPNKKIIPGKFDEPTGIAVDSQENVYVDDSATVTVQKFNSGGEFIRALISDGRTNGVNFSSPQGVAVGEDGSLYVVDSGNYRIVKLDGDMLTIGDQKELETVNSSQ